MVASFVGIFRNHIFCCLHCVIGGRILGVSTILLKKKRLVKKDFCHLNVTLGSLGIYTQGFVLNLKEFSFVF